MAIAVELKHSIHTIEIITLFNNLLEKTGGGARPEAGVVKYPGVRDAIDGNTAVILVEREASDAAGAYPITPSTQMGEYRAESVAAGHVNLSGRPLIFVELESEHAAAGCPPSGTWTCPWCPAR
jgi:pyruvate-ferredoxin/flavodoxin oxidoreductase